MCDGNVDYLASDVKVFLNPDPKTVTAPQLPLNLTVSITGDLSQAVCDGDYRVVVCLCSKLVVSLSQHILSLELARFLESENLKI